MLIKVDDNKAYLESKIGSLTIGDYFGAALKKRNRKIHEVSLSSGVNHAIAYRLRTDENNSLKAFIALMDELGYEVIIREKSDAS